MTARGMSLSTIIIFTKKMEIKKKKNHNYKKKKSYLFKEEFYMKI